MKHILSVFSPRLSQGMTGGRVLGTVCGYIKAIDLILFPHQRSICAEGLQGRHALSMLGRTLIMSAYVYLFLNCILFFYLFHFLLCHLSGIWHQLFFVINFVATPPFPPTLQFLDLQQCTNHNLASTICHAYQVTPPVDE